MHSDPKQDAQKAEEAGLTAQPIVPPSVAKPDEQSIDAAVEKEKALKKKAARHPSPQSQDRLDLERAAGEGMPPPSHP